MRKISNAVTVSEGPTKLFREKAGDLMIVAAQMTLHQLVDEFVRLCEVIEANSEDAPEGSYGKQLNDTAQIASRKQRIISAAVRARFGISLHPFDRDMDGGESF